jgi:sec-independent protein translocase protein TatB
MFDMGWSELLVVGVVALIVVGPKDLPVLFRKVGQFVGKAKGMAREFSNAMNDAADDTGMREMSSSLDEVKSATKSLSKFDPESETGKLASQRAEDVKKIQAATARAGAERKQREAAEALAQADAAEAKLATPAAAPQIEKPAAKAPAKKAPAKKAAAAKTPAKATPAKKPAAKKPAAAKPAAKKAAPKAPAAKKSDT